MSWRFPTLERMNGVAERTADLLRMRVAETSIAPGRRRLKWSGAVIALVGFGLARTALLTTTVVRTDATFLLGATLPVVFGLGLTAFGVGLTVSTLDRAYVRTVMRWTLGGAGGVALTVAVTVLSPGDALTFMNPDPELIRLVVNVVIAGAVGGTLVGLKSASNRRHRRAAARRAARSTVLNRLLRHEVLNAVQVILGYADRPVGPDDDPTATREVIRSRAAMIAETVDDIGFLIGLGDTSEEGLQLRPVDFGAALEATVSRVTAEYDGTVTLVDGTQADYVWATEEVEYALEELIENALRHAKVGDEPPSVRVEVERRPETVHVSITDDGPGLPPRQRAILEGRRLPEYDDPSTGFGIPRARLLLNEYDATVRVSSPPGRSELGPGTRIELEFARAAAGAVDRVGDRPPRAELRRLGTTAAIATAAGIGMGGVLAVFSDTIPVIGGLYGMREPLVGWVFHLFHSVVFGLVFTAAIEWKPARTSLESPLEYGFVGLSYGVGLWLVAGGIVMPLWSNAVGDTLMVPFLTLPSLAGHLLWGGVFGFGVGVWDAWGPGYGGDRNSMRTDDAIEGLTDADDRERRG